MRKAIYQYLVLFFIVVLVAGDTQHARATERDDVSPETCPNEDPGSGSMDGGGATGGNPGPDQSGGGSGPGGHEDESEKTCPPPTAATGDPIEATKGMVIRRETDFSIPVKYGLSLNVARIYSSKYFTFGNNNGLTMFGPKWHGSYEWSLVEDTYVYDSVIYHDFVLFDGSGHQHNFFQVDRRSEYYAPWSTNTYVYPNRWSQSGPLELRLKQSSPDSYVVTDGQRHQHIFTPMTVGGEVFLKLTAIEADAWTAAEERITLEYDTDLKLTKVHAPSGDDRYLNFVYDGTAPEYQLEKVELKDGSDTYPVVFYSYDAYGRLYKVRTSSPSNDSYVQYDYGSFDGSSFAPDSSYRLGRVSGHRGSILTPITAFKYEHLNFTDVGFYSWRATKNYIYDVDTATWSEAAALTYSSWYSSNIVAPEGSGTPPKSYITVDIQHDILEVSYADLDSLKPKYKTILPSAPSGITWTDWTRPRARNGEMLASPSTGTYDRLVSAVERDYQNSSYLDTFRALTRTQYSAASLSSAMTTAYSYSATFPNRVVSIISPTGEETSATFGTDSSSAPEYGRVISTAHNGLVKTFEYDGDGLLQKVTAPYGLVTSYTYDSRGQTTSVETPDGSISTFTYNDFGQVQTACDTHLALTRTMKYSSELSTSDPQYFLPPRLVQITAPGNRVTQFRYDSSGNQTEREDPSGLVTVKTYDIDGRTLTRTNAAGETESFDYDKFGRLAEFVDGRGKITTYTYDEFSRPLRVTDPDGNYRETAYGDESNTGGCGCGGATSKPIRVRQEDGQYIHFSYDWAGRLEKVWYSGNAMLSTSEQATPQLAYSYDNSSRLLSEMDTRLTLASPPSGVIKSYTYSYDSGPDGTGNLLSITHPEGYKQEFFYGHNMGTNDFRRLVASKDVDGNVTRYTYDSLGRLLSLVDPYSATTSYNYATPSDDTYPIGAVKRISKGNGTKTDYSFDERGRIDRIDYMDSNNSCFDFIDLSYAPSGMIADRERRDGSSWYKTVYSYDNAYRLTGETNQTAANVFQASRSYGYDTGGNRTSMTIHNAGGVNKLTTYTYGNRSQLISNTGYFGEGTTDTGPMTYSWDVRGNIATRTRQSYEWNEDNRLTHVLVSSGDPKQEILQNFYRYDSDGRRILSWTSVNGQRTRHFFRGLTEEIRKVSVGTHSDASFGQSLRMDAESGLLGFTSSGYTSAIAIVADSARLSNVYSVSNWWTNGRGYWESGTGWNLSGYRTFSLWLRSGGTSAVLEIYVRTTDGCEYSLAYAAGSGANYVQAGQRCWIYLAGTSQSFSGSTWLRLERDLQADLAVFFPGKSISIVKGASGWGTFSMDDLRFSNSLTAEHNVLAGGVVGHILRNRVTNPISYAPTDRWFHYDQVGSVIAESDASGALVQTHHQDAFGNTQVAWNTGLWGGDRPGWHHNTKELDGETGLVYMWQRWYSPESGMFVSTSPFGAETEAPYQFTWNAPTHAHDATGLFSTTGDCCTSNMPSTNQLVARINSSITDPSGKYLDCMTSRAKNAKVTCRKTEGRCNDAETRAHTAVGSTTFPTEGVSICADKLAGCGTIDIENIMIHEFAHACGMPDEKDWNNGKPGLPWDTMGIVGIPGGRYDCTGK